MFFSTMHMAVGLEFDNKTSSTMQDRLQKLERQLLLNKDEEEDLVNTSGLAVTTTKWSDAVQ